MYAKERPIITSPWMIYCLLFDTGRLFVLSVCWGLGGGDGGLQEGLRGGNSGGSPSELDNDDDEDDEDDDVDDDVDGGGGSEEALTTDTARGGSGGRPLEGLLPGFAELSARNR